MRKMNAKMRLIDRSSHDIGDKLVDIPLYEIKVINYLSTSLRVHSSKKNNHAMRVLNWIQEIWAVATMSFGDPIGHYTNSCQAMRGTVEIDTTE